MREEIPVIPVVEVRETFTPSERLRDELANLLSLDLDDDMKESLRATFLFKSWQRRVIKQEEYYASEHGRAGTVYQATRIFDALPRRPITFSSRVAFFEGSKEGRYSRLALRAVNPPELITQAKDILNIIPTCEDELPLGTEGLLYVEFAKRSLRAGLQRNYLLTKFEGRLDDPGTSRLFNVTSDRMITRDTIMRQPADNTDA